MVQSGDEQLCCPELQREMADNRAGIDRLLQKDKQVEQENVAKGVGGALPGVGLLLVGSTDLSNEEQVKARALGDRNERLSYLAKQKGCTP